MKNFWKKYKVIIIVILAIAAFVGLSFLAEGSKPAIEEPSADLNAWVESVESDEYVITVIGLSYCGHCKEYKPVVTEIASEYSIPFYYFDIDTVTQDEASLISSSYAFTEYEGASPYTAITKNGEVVAQYAQGYMDKETTIQFLKDCGAIK